MGIFPFCYHNVSLWGRCDSVPALIVLIIIISLVWLARNVDKIEKMNIVVYNLSWMIPATIIFGLLVPYEFRLLNGIFDSMSYGSSSDAVGGTGIAWMLPIIVSLSFLFRKKK